MTFRPLTNHNVYIIGAGFSRDAGFPLIFDFIDKMAECQEWLEGQETRQTEIASIDEVFKFQQSANSVAAKVNLDPNNIEDLFSLASASFNPDLITNLKLAVASTIDFCDKTKSLSAQQLQIMAEGHKTFSTGFDAYNNYLRLMTGWVLSEDYHPIDVCTRPHSTFITFNYDTMLEHGLDQIGMSYTYGFEADSIDYAAGAKCSKDGAGLKLLKIHGSVNWGQSAVYGNYDELRSADDTPLLVPPTWEKSIEPNLLSVWQHAITSLSTARNIVIVGFSMPTTDVHFKYLVAAGLKDSIALRKIVFVNPSLKDESNDENDELKRNVYRIFRRDLAGVKILFKQMSIKEFLGNPVCLGEIGRLDGRNILKIVD